VAKRKKAGSAEQEFQERFERFFLSSELADLAGNALSERACIAIHLEGEDYYFCRRKGVNVLLRTEPCPPDVHFWSPLASMRHLLDLAEHPHTGIGTLGVAIFEYLFAQDEEKKIKFRVDTGFLGLWAKGYFSVLKAGGPEVASYLGRVGFGSVTRIKEALKNIRT
jgi:hypothetical protein